MRDKLKYLESKIKEFAEYSKFDSATLDGFPDELKILNDFKIFGADLLALPAEYVIPGDKGEPQIPFRFVQDKSELELFEEEFREEIPADFIQFGYLCGTELVLFDKTRLTVHFFHVSDVCDPDWLKEKLKNKISTFKEFITAIEPQTISCFINPNDASDYDIFEIKDDNSVVYGIRYGNSDGEYGEIKSDTREAAWKMYFELTKKSIGRGLNLHYGPKKLKMKLA